MAVGVTSLTTFPSGPTVDISVTTTLSFERSKALVPQGKIFPSEAIVKVPLSFTLATRHFELFMAKAQQVRSRRHHPGCQ